MSRVFSTDTLPLHLRGISKKKEREQEAPKKKKKKKAGVGEYVCGNE